MKNLPLRLFACCLAVLPIAATGEDIDPFADGRPDVPDESDPRIVTAEGKITLKLLETVKIPSIRLTPETRYDAYRIIKEEMGKHGVTVRLKERGSETMVPSQDLALRNVPVGKLLDFLRGWAWWGWILYPDGSITLFDSQCACTWPKGGLYCHDSQYEEGKPEVMAKDEKKRAEDAKAEQGGGAEKVAPAQRPEAEEKKGKAKPESEERSR